MCSGERTQPTLAEWHSGSPALAAPDRESGVMTPLRLPHGELEAWEPALCLECCEHSSGPPRPSPSLVPPPPNSESPETESHRGLPSPRHLSPHSSWLPQLPALLSQPPCWSHWLQTQGPQASFPPPTITPLLCSGLLVAPKGPFPAKAFCFGAFTCSIRCLYLLLALVLRMLCFILGKSLPLLSLS